MVDMISKLELCRFSGAGRVENTVEHAYMGSLPAYPYLDRKPPILGVEVNSIHTSPIALASLHVPAILGLSHITKIANSVISGIAIYMVNVSAWKRTVMIKPSKAVSLPYAAKNPDPDISTFLGCRPHRLACFPSSKGCPKLVSTSILPACENTSFMVIINVLLKLFLSDHFCTLVKAVERMRQPLTRWSSGCIPSRKRTLSTKSVSRQCLKRK
jgi:hypothetical protein